MKPTNGSKRGRLGANLTLKLGGKRMTAEELAAQEAEAAAKLAEEEAAKLASQNGETPEEKEAREAEEKAKAEEGKLTLEDQKTVNARIAELTKEKKDALKKAEELEARLEALETKDKGEKVWTREELKKILADPEQSDYHLAAQEKLAEVIADEKIKKMQEDAEVKTAPQRSLARAYEDFPEFFPIDKLTGRRGVDQEAKEVAERIFEEEGLANHVNGQYLAYKMAKAELNEGKAKKNLGLENKLRKENAKDSLGGSTKKPSPVSRDAQAMKLFNAAQGTPTTSAEWKAWRKFVQENPDPKEAAREAELKRING